MKSRYNEFLCNGCETEFLAHNVVIAETEDEFKKLRAALLPPFVEFTNNSLVKQFPCGNTDCTGKINVVMVETSY